MRIVLKPLGVMVLLFAISTLSYVAFRRNESKNPVVLAETVAVESSALPAGSLLPGNTIYDDSLQNGWEDWSWTKLRDFAATDAPEGASGTVIRATLSGDEAIYLSHVPFPSAPYDRVAFSVHGGKGGQKLDVSAIAGRNTAGGNEPYGSLVLPSLSANRWDEIVIPLSNLQAANKPDLGGFWIRLDRAGSHDPIYVDNVRLLTPSDAN